MGALKIFSFIFLVLPTILFVVLLLTTPISYLSGYSYTNTFFIFFVPLIGFGIWAFGFWIWMLADDLQRENFSDKVLWILILLLVPFIGMILYYFIVYSKLPRKGQTKVQSPPAVK